MFARDYDLVVLAEPHADVIFGPGRLWTRGRGPFVGCLAVRDGRIAAMGLEAELRTLRGPRTRVVSIADGLLLPAFQDAHVHPVWGGLASMACDLSAWETPDEWLTAVGRYAAEHADEPVITGEGWTPYPFGAAFPGRDLLDSVVAHRPVVLDSRDGHSTWVNSAALRATGVDRDTPDPARGRIERDRRGEPTGVFHEDARALVHVLRPEPDAERIEEALRRGQAYLHGLGVGGWLDATVEPASDAAYLALAARGQLTGRAALALTWDPSRGLGQIDELVARRRVLADVGHAGLQATAVKLFVDGVIESSTAALLEPYADGSAADPTGRGASTYPPEVLVAICRAIDAAAFDIHAHAIGDRAAREALDAIEAAVVANGRRDARHAIAHLELVDAPDVPRFAHLGVIADCQALWAVHDETDAILEPRLGPERLEARYPFGSLARAGAALAMGSDWNVSTADPLQAIRAAVTRMPPGNPRRPLGAPRERLALEQALEAYTHGSARVLHSDDLSGRLEPGMSADLVLLDADPLVPGVGAGDCRVLLTMVGGRIVHEDRAPG